MSGQIMRLFLIVLSIVSITGCGLSSSERSNASVQPTYDKVTGKLKELAYDSNGNGRVDTWTEMNGAVPLRSRIDKNEDGKIDRWEEYDANGGLVKVGFSRSDNGKPDAWVFSGPDGTVRRIEISSTGDEHRIDRWEYYDASLAGPDGRGALVRADQDTTHDGKPDKWETYENGVLKVVAFDENGNGRPNRRLTYAASGLLTIDSDPDASGRFTRRVESR
jgi:hypothetical protein